MKKIKVLSILFAILCITNIQAQDAKTRYVGGDISLLPDYENAHAVYKDNAGNTITDVLKFCYDEGMNIMRVRLFVNPDDYTGPDKDANAKQDLDYIIPLCKRIKDDGFALMLDFHYSDTWADPVKQWTPLAWQGLTDEELYQKIYDYTKESLETLKAQGIVPDFIQPGNEISYGMLWGPRNTKDNKVYPDSDENWPRFTNLLKNAIKACREVCPEAGIVIHNERVAKLSMLTGFYKKIQEYGIDYDIIGLSYYPYFHGSLTVLNNALTSLELQYRDKDIMIVETGYSYAWEVPGTTEKVDYEYSEKGQDEFAKALVETLLKHSSCTGLIWWWMEYNAFNTSLSGWYNAPLFDSRTGRALKALETICTFGTGHDINTGIESVNGFESEADAKWYDLQGRPVKNPSLPGLYINNGRKVVVR